MSMYAQLGTSYQWTLMNANDALMNKIQDVLKEGMILSPEDIPSTVLKLKNRLKSPITTKILDAINNGQIIIVYAPSIKIPLYLPFIITQSAPNSFVGYVFANNYVTNAYSKGIEPEFDDRKFKVVLESCYISLQIRKVGDSPKLRSTAILKSGSKIYSGIVTECINRRHNIRLDENLYNAVLYLTSKFYIYNMLGCSNMSEDALQNYCLYNCKQFDITELSKIIDQFGPEDFTDISKFITKFTQVPECKKRLSNLTMTNFLEAFINMYDTPMLFGLEVFPYLLYNIMAVNESTYINNYQTLKNLVGDDGRKIYADLIVSLC